MAKKRIPEVPRDGSEVDFIPQNFMLIDGAEGSAKMRMDLFGKASSVESLRTDLSGKADKVSGATAGDVATLDANGNLADSGKTLGTSVPADAVFTDSKVMHAKLDSGDTAYPLLMSALTNPNGQATSVRYDSAVLLTPSTNTISANISGNAATATKLGTDAGDSTHPCFFNGGIPRQCLGVSTFSLFWGTMLVSWDNISGKVEPSGGNKQYIVTGSGTIDLHKTGGTHGDTGCTHFRVKGDGNGCCTLTVQYLDVFGNSRSFEIYWGNSSHLTRVNEFVVFWADNLFPSYSTVYRHCTIVPVRLPDLGTWDGESV
jgi:hypothetical protein